MGISYQFQQQKDEIAGASKHATSLFVKSVGFVKTICSISKEKLW
jgi:hypothetical protein